MRLYAALLLILPLGIAQAHDKAVLLAANRLGNVEVFDPVTLESLGSIRILPQINGVASDGKGLLLLLEGIAPDFQGCCALYAMDIKTLRMTKLIEPASNIIISPDGHHVLTQRGAVGVESFSLKTLEQEAGIARSTAPGVYTLRFSPDGGLLFGVSNFPTPTLDIFDFAERKLVQRFSAPQGFTVLGTWIGDEYYLYAHREGRGRLWRIKTDAPALEDPVEVNFPDAAPECKMRSQEVLGTGNQLFLYERFGAKIDRRNGCATSIPGGLLLVDPQSGEILARLAPGFHFASLISSADSKELYGVDVRDTNWTSVGLVRLNATTGEVLARRTLSQGVWVIDVATIPSELVPSRPANRAVYSVIPK
jgi:hypothetical protein